MKANSQQNGHAIGCCDERQLPQQMTSIASQFMKEVGISTSPLLVVQLSLPGICRLSSKVRKIWCDGSGSALLVMPEDETVQVTRQTCSMSKFVGMKGLRLGR